MISIKEIMKKDFCKLSSSDSVGSAVKVMDKRKVDYVLIEEKGEIKGVITSHELMGYPSSRLILDCVIKPVAFISEKILLDEALKVLEEKKVSFLVILNKEGTLIGVINQEIIISFLYQQLKKSNQEKEKDITELKEAEEKLKKSKKEAESALQKLKETQAQLIQAGKLTALGTLGSGIAHQLNQPLTGIRGFVQNILMEIDRKSPHHGDLKTIEEQTGYMRDIIENIRAFARETGVKKRSLNINEAIEKTLLLLSEQLRLHGIELVKKLDPHLPKIKGNLNQLQQVFANLLINAREALDAQKGERQKKLTVVSKLSRDKKWAEVEISDTGIGIPDKIKDKIFDPFFSTKGPKGTGLGLSLSYGIIEDHKGSIEVTSKIGKGTTFKVMLPVRSNKKCDYDSKKTKSQNLSRDDEKIVLPLFAGTF